MTFGVDDLTDTSGQDEAKFNLYLKHHELEQLSDVLTGILDRSPSQQRAWVKENRDMLDSLFDTCMSEASGVLDGLVMDKETMDLSIKFVDKLRSTMAILQSIVKEPVAFR